MAGSPGRGASGGDTSTGGIRKENLNRPQPGRRSERPRGSTIPSRVCVLGEYGQQTGRQLLVVRPGENDSGTHQTRDQATCYKWKDRQTVMWARVQEAIKRGKAEVACGRPAGGREVQPSGPSTFCGAPTLGERPLQWRKVGTARARRRRRRRSRHRRTERRSAESSDRGPLVSGFLCNFFCPVILHLHCPLLGAHYFARQATVSVGCCLPGDMTKERQMKRPKKNKA